MRRVSALVPACVFLVATFAGCLGGDDAPSTSTALTTPAPSSPTAPTSPGAPPAPGTTSPPGSPPSTTTGAPPPPPRSEVYEGSIVFRAVPPLGPLLDVPANTNANLELTIDGGITGYLIDLVWTPFTPATASMGIWVRKGANDDHDFLIEGPGPLRLAVPANETSGGTYALDIIPAVEPARVAINQAFTMTVTVFDGAPFDPLYVPTA